MGNLFTRRRRERVCHCGSCIVAALPPSLHTPIVRMRWLETFGWLLLAFLSPLTHPLRCGAEMIQLYIVLALLILECVLVFVLLLPVNYSLLRPLRYVQVLLAKQLSNSTIKKVLLTVALILAFLVVESFQEMRYREIEDRKAHTAGALPVKVHDNVILKLNKFRSERNFYLTFFT